MKKSSTRVTVVVLCLIIAVVGYYTYLVNRTRSITSAETEMTYVEKVLSRSLERDYPPTPKEVMKYYHEIMKCFYNEECTDAEVEALGLQARLLYDDELVEKNEYGPYMMNLKNEIKDYKDKKRRITSFSVAASTDVDNFTEDGYQFARILCGYKVVEGKMTIPTEQVYLLRRDEDGHWKIYGWELAENVDKYKESQE